MRQGVRASLNARKTQTLPWAVSILRRFFKGMEAAGIIPNFIQILIQFIY